MFHVIVVNLVVNAMDIFQTILRDTRPWVDIELVVVVANHGAHR